MPKLELFTNRVEIDGESFPFNELKDQDESGDLVSVVYTQSASNVTKSVRSLYQLPYTEWTDSGDTPYASKAALLSDMKAFFFKVGAGGTVGDIETLGTSELDRLKKLYPDGVGGVVWENKTPLVIEVFTKSDLPAPSLGIISLDTDNTVYIFLAEVDISPDVLVINADNIVLKAENSGTNGIVSGSTSAVITANNRGLNLENLNVVAFSATHGVNIVGSGTEIVLIDRCTLVGMDTHIEVDSIGIYAHEFCLHSFGINGVKLNGAIKNQLISKVVFEGLTGNLIDLGTSTSDAVALDLNTAVLEPTSTFLTIASNSANINAGGEGTITDNKVNMLAGGTSTSGYSPLDVLWYVAGNGNITTSDRLQPTGWGIYDDDALTTQAFDGTPAKLLINGLGAITNESQLPRVIRGVGSLWDTVNDAIVPIDIGDSYDMRIQFDIINSGGNPTRFNIGLDIGPIPDGTGIAPNSIIIAEDSKTLKNGTPQTHIITFPAFTLATFAANNGTLWISADSGTIEILARQILIVRTSSGAS